MFKGEQSRHCSPQPLMSGPKQRGPSRVRVADGDRVVGGGGHGGAAHDGLNGEGPCWMM